MYIIAEDPYIIYIFNYQWTINDTNKSIIKQAVERKLLKLYWETLTYDEALKHLQTPINDYNCSTAIAMKENMNSMLNNIQILDRQQFYKYIRKQKKIGGKWFRKYKIYKTLQIWQNS